MMTEQEIFDKVAAHLINQNSRSTKSDDCGQCAYRGAHGRRCAAGVLIEDSEYNATIEGLSWPFTSKTTDITGGLLLISIAGRIGHHSLVKELQRIHDGEDVETWPDRLRELAIRKSLDFSVVGRG